MKTIGIALLTILLLSSFGLTNLQASIKLASAQASTTETYEVSVHLPMGYSGYINVLIPPDASVLSAQSLGTSGVSSLTLEYVSNVSLRCYRFAQIFAKYEGRNDSARVNLQILVNRNSIPYVSCGDDELADKIIDRLMSCPVSGNGLPGMSFGNLEKAREWRGYPLLSVNKKLGYQLPQQNVDYLVIAKEGIDLNKFLYWKRMQEFNVYLVTTQDINYYYNGDTLQSKTREFLKDAFNTWHMEYVLIVGGTNTLPPISYQVYNCSLVSYGTDNRTTDYYYMTLEQPVDKFSFNSSKRLCVDFPDFVLGRFPSDNPQEIQNMVEKTISYAQTTSLGEWVRTNLLVVGEAAPGGPTWEWEQYTKDDRPKLELVYPKNLTLQTLIDVLDQGVGSMVMNAHASPYGWLLGGGENLNYQTVDYMSNTKLPVIFSVGCHSGKFDAEQSVAVKMLGKSTGGAVAIVAGTSFTPYGHCVYFSAYNYWESCVIEQWRIPNANYHVGKAFFYFVALNAMEHMILLGDPSLILATNYLSPGAYFTFSPAIPHVYETITFDARASFSPYGPITSYTWDFGDGNITIFDKPTLRHTYIMPGNYNVTLTVANEAGFKNSTTKSLTVLQDDVPPVGSIKINGNATYATSNLVTLTLTATDTISGVYQIRLSNDGVWDSEPWEDFSPTKKWTLKTGDGMKTVYYQIKDKAGLTSETLSDTIILDTAPPDIQITSPTAGCEIKSSNITVTWTASDETSGISHYRIRLNDGSWINLGTNTAYTFTGLKDGEYIITVSATDTAGLAKQKSVGFIVKLPKAAEFVVADLTISPTEILVGQKITISITVTNVGEEKGSYTVTLKVKGKITDNKSVTLSGGESTTVTFELTAEEAGTFDVELSGLRGAFVAKAPSPWGSYAVIAGIIVAALGVAVTLSQIKRSKELKKKNKT